MIKRGVCFVSGFIAIMNLNAQDTTQQIVPGRSNAASQYQKPYVVLISADGFRYDLAEKYDAVFLKQMSGRGVRATSMKPCFPTLTFPNHYSIATGLYPAHHGIVDNTFYDVNKKQIYAIRNRNAVSDSSWYGGTPIWVLAEEQQMMSASFYWVGSESKIKGYYPSYYFKYNEKIPIDRRIDIVKNWLSLPEAQRPHLITFYFPEVDHAEHRYGTESHQTAEAVHFVDQSVKQLYEVCKQSGLPVNFIFLSDHGMADMDTLHPITLPVKIDTSKFIMTYGATTVHLYAKEKKFIKPLYRQLKSGAEDYKVFLVKKTPRRWHYSKRDDRYNRIGDILLTPKAPPKGFSIHGKKLLPGQHGFDNIFPEMQATFYAWGPAFKEGMVIDNFENINVYPMIARILGLKISEQIDGREEVLDPILKDLQTR